ncbi:hypothetical protein [Halobacterium salinarum]|uniref:Uncharacterized protein n=2 Tax=Halobacterium salinarum TaxID=2242 RepID=B0RA29_HALS3|nr:hypothetical protein [Halobacterium salinarum]MBB6090887.1 hypothetical protein [Halobacterium salinarum]UEB93165.1 hypothetical protein LJ422_11585 [Halobacterium salinarum NRC-34001]CAP15624.2 uncharacterized protein OE_5314F [Halobacterium salinarum R1]
MDKRSPSRRAVLSFLGSGVAVGLAGCSRLSGTAPAAEGSDQSENTASDPPEISISISTEAEPAQLPSIWTDSESIEEFQARFSVETSGQPTQAAVSNGDVEIRQDSEQWNGTSVTVQPGQMRTGNQEFEATAQKNNVKVEDTAQASKNTPGSYKLDVIPGKNEPLRQTIQEDSDEDTYLEDRGEFIAEDPVFSSYNSHQNLEFDKLRIDLAAMEWRHDNDYETLESDYQDPEAKNFVDSIGTDTGNPDIQAIKNGEKGVTTYPNGDFDNRTVGSFDYESFANAETLGGALDSLHSYYFNWQAVMTGSGPISSEDFVYAPTLEQAIEQKNNKDLQAHAWDFNLDEHGNGLIYGENADGSDELRIMETISNPVTATPQTLHEQRHPLVEDSNYLNPDHDEFNRYWHPLRFGWDEYSDSTRWEFEQEKGRAFAVAANMTQSVRDNRSADTLTPTTGYLQDFTEKLRTYNQNDADFEELYNQAKIMDKLMRDEENNHVVYGDTENPQCAVIEDDEVVDEVWEDEDGKYDDFDQFLRDNSSYSMGTEEVDVTLNQKV